MLSTPEAGPDHDLELLAALEGVGVDLGRADDEDGGVHGGDALARAASLSPGSQTTSSASFLSSAIPKLSNLSAMRIFMTCSGKDASALGTCCALHITTPGEPVIVPRRRGVVQ